MLLLWRDSSCIDVAAHVGSILEHMVRLAPTGRHLAFEHSVGARRYGGGPDRVYELLTERAGVRIFDIDGGGPLRPLRAAGRGAVPAPLVLLRPPLGLVLD